MSDKFRLTLCAPHTTFINNFMQHSSSAGQETRNILMNPGVHYRSNNSWHIFPKLSKINQVQICQSYLRSVLYFPPIYAYFLQVVSSHQPQIFIQLKRDFNKYFICNTLLPEVHVLMFSRQLPKSGRKR